MAASGAPIILCAGVAVQDLMMRVPGFPQPGEKARASSLDYITGGCSVNAATAMARLGGNTRYTGPLGGPAGSDEAGDRILADLAREGVDCSGVERLEGVRTPVSMIMIDAAGEKLVATHRDRRINELRPRDPGTLVEGIDALLADNCFAEFVLPVCQVAHSRGILTVLDADKAASADDPLFTLCTHLVFSSEALRSTVGESDLGTALLQMTKHTPAFLAVTDGPNDILWIEAGALRRTPAFAIDAVDTLGAGDVFHAAFTLGLAEGLNVQDAMRFAAAAAAVKCTRFGGGMSAPTRAEVETFLLSHSGSRAAAVRNA